MSIYVFIFIDPFIISICPFVIFLSIHLFLGDDSVAEKFLSYNRANRAVAILCNHQRTAPKSFDQQMTNLQAKVTKETMY